MNALNGNCNIATNDEMATRIVRRAVTCIEAIASNAPNFPSVFFGR